MKRKKKIVLIGGLDPTGHAGLLADVRVLEDLGLPYFTVATALTAQTDKRFFAWESCSPKLFRGQLEACGSDIIGVKIGMLGDTRLIPPLVQWLDRVQPRHVLWDPVFESTSGGKLISAKKWNGGLKNLLHRTTLWTPNIPEAEWVLGRSITHTIDMEGAAEELWKMGKKQDCWVLLKGGHLPRKQKWIVDLLYDGKKIRRFSGKRLKKNPRGTGCTLGSALLSYLVQNRPITQALKQARAYLKLSKF